jgi:ABC-type multidrug transport system ATPase subunit
VLLSTHVVEDIRYLADQVLILHDGRLAFVGTVDVLASMAHPGERGDSDLERGYLSVLCPHERGNRGGVPG